MGVIDRFRLRLALWLMPAVNTAHAKRRLQRVAQSCGVPRKLAITLASVYYGGLHDGR